MGRLPLRKVWITTDLHIKTEAYPTLYAICRERGLKYDTVWHHIKRKGYYSDGELIIQRKPVERAFVTRKRKR